MIRKIAGEKVDVLIDGNRVRMTRAEAMLRELFLSNKRKPKETLRLLDLIKDVEENLEGGAEAADDHCGVCKRSGPKGYPERLLRC